MAIQAIARAVCMAIQCIRSSCFDMCHERAVFNFDIAAAYVDCVPANRDSSAKTTFGQRCLAPKLAIGTPLLYLGAKIDLRARDGREVRDVP